ncbi:hypothetical protein FRC10_008220 [Ceratobasidium sp. 414]|nr:hypothetical protein FRC10_008220 [Ceratobasidium sp. 414]
MSGFKRSINTLQIPQAQRAKLIKNGYTTVADIQAVSAIELSKDLGFSLGDATSIIVASNPLTQSQVVASIIRPSASQRAHIAIGGSQTAAALLRVPASATALSLGVKAIDELLDGGALKGCVTEICGVPGSGRSAAATSVFASAVKAGHERSKLDSRGDLSIEKLKTAIDTSTLDIGKFLSLLSGFLNYILQQNDPQQGNYTIRELHRCLSSYLVCRLSPNTVATTRT